MGLYIQRCWALASWLAQGGGITHPRGPSQAQWGAGLCGIGATGIGAHFHFGPAPRIFFAPGGNFFLLLGGIFFCSWGGFFLFGSIGGRFFLEPSINQGCSINQGYSGGSV